MSVCGALSLKHTQTSSPGRTFKKRYAPASLAADGACSHLVTLSNLVEIGSCKLGLE